MKYTFNHPASCGFKSGQSYTYEQIKAILGERRAKLLLDVMFEVIGEKDKEIKITRK